MIILQIDCCDCKVPTDLIEEELLRQAGGEEAGGGCEVGEGLHAGVGVSSDWGDCSQVTLLSALRSGIFIPGSASLSAPRVRTLRTLRSLKSPIRIAASGLSQAFRSEFLGRGSRK